MSSRFFRPEQAKADAGAVEQPEIILLGERLLAEYERLQEPAEGAGFAELFEPAELAERLLAELIKKAQGKGAQVRSAAWEPESGGRQITARQILAAAPLGAQAEEGGSAGHIWAAEAEIGSKSKSHGETDGVSTAPALFSAGVESAVDGLLLGEVPELPELRQANEGADYSEIARHSPCADGVSEGGGERTRSIGGAALGWPESLPGERSVAVARENERGSGGEAAETAITPGGETGVYQELAMAGYVSGQAARESDIGTVWREEELRLLCELVAERLGNELAVYLQSRPWPVR